MSAPQFRLRPAHPTDLVAIVALEQATPYAPHWSPAVYATILADRGENGDPQAEAPPRCIFVAEQGHEGRVSLAGFAVALIRPVTEGPPSVQVAELESAAVAVDARRTGIGRALCRAAIDWSRANGATSLVLEVRASSAGAIALYAGLGFAATGRRPRYYRDPKDDALNMTLDLV